MASIISYLDDKFPEEHVTLEQVKRFEKYIAVEGNPLSLLAQGPKVSDSLYCQKRSTPLKDVLFQFIDFGYENFVPYFYFYERTKQYNRGIFHSREGFSFLFTNGTVMQIQENMVGIHM